MRGEQQTQQRFQRILKDKKIKNRYIITNLAAICSTHVMPLRHNDITGKKTKQEAYAL